MLEARNLTKKFQNHTALHPLDLSVNAGEIMCLLGANGAGKTTTINLFLGFLTPTSGEAWVNGLQVESNPQASKAGLAYIPEQVALYPDLTGFENLQFFHQLSGQPATTEELQAHLDRAGLARTFFDTKAGEYSKGMRQKVGIAIALAKDAKALLLDEPLSGLDPKAANEFCSLLQDMKEQGKSVLMATHDLFRAKEVGSQIGIMKQGRLLQQIDPLSLNANELEAIYLQHMHDDDAEAA